MQALATRDGLNARVYGKEYTEIPEDLFIPPDALEVLLDSFSGPLDLLLYLIRKQNIDILDIPMMTITKQYLQYIAFLFQSNAEHRMELAAEYLLMATVLAEIKSKMLLPRITSHEEESDPRMDLVRQLQAYEEMKQAALKIDALPRRDRDTFLMNIQSMDKKITKNHPTVDLMDLIGAMKTLLEKKDCFLQHVISRERLSVRERMTAILLQLKDNQRLEFTQLYTFQEGKEGLIVSFLAVLELARQALIVITQSQAFSVIYIKTALYG